ncbi:hypothetical protein SAMN05444273_10839 [Litoreibacter ascidiaceicola]|uniref:Uncharacterized protein n=1 Tax=Litoreibacter ascidiaceicola TaxID=1486859 RepID=A0A1M5D0B2_9RHOB|nr:hypothetical protein SAMN05444273_10839 [Litoreibacter ascidiaceicola]
MKVTERRLSAATGLWGCCIAPTDCNLQFRGLRRLGQWIYGLTIRLIRLIIKWFVRHIPPAMNACVGLTLCTTWYF